MIKFVEMIPQVRTIPIPVLKIIRAIPESRKNTINDPIVQNMAMTI